MRFDVEISPSPDDTEAISNPPPHAILHVTIPPTYPAVFPQYDITLDPPITAYPFLTFPDDKDKLMQALEEAIADFEGMPMIFTLVSTLKETAEQLLDDRVQRKKKAVHQAKEAEYEKEMAKFKGELVTKERYQVWRKNWQDEINAERAREKEKEEEEMKKRGASVAKEKKLTGRQLFERGIAGAGHEDSEDDKE